MRREFGWSVGVWALFAGAVGGLAAGVWLRLLMRLVAIVEPSPVAHIQDPEGRLRLAPIPTFSVEGTVAVIFPALLLGTLLGLLLLIPWLIWPDIVRWGRGVLLGMALLVVPGALLMRATPELEIGNRVLSTLLFAVTPFVYGLVYAAVLGRFARG